MTESERIDKEWEKQEQEMIAFMDKIDAEQKLLRLYSNFANFPQKIKREIFIHIAFIIGMTILVCMAVFTLDYKSPLLFATYAAITLFLGWKVFIAFFYLKHAHFITFTGKITESYPIGSKISGSKHFVVKLQADDEKELCFPYYGSQVLHYDQYITLFINKNANVELSQWGPFISQYIDAIPTDEINARLKLIDETNSGAISANDYINK